MVTITRAKKTVAKSPAKSTKAPARKTATAAPATKRPVGRPRKAAEPVVTDNKPVRRASPAKASAPATRKAKPAAAPAVEAKPVMDARKKVGGLSFRELSDLTGYGVGSERFIVAVEVLRGGESRRDVLHRLNEVLPAETRNGTPKQVSNVLSSVINHLTGLGFTEKGTWSMVKPAK
jgi:hypothetical protein